MSKYQTANVLYHFLGVTHFPVYQVNTHIRPLDWSYFGNNVEIQKHMEIPKTSERGDVKEQIKVTWMYGSLDTSYFPLDETLSSSRLPYLIHNDPQEMAIVGSCLSTYLVGSKSITLITLSRGGVRAQNDQTSWHQVSIISEVMWG